MALVIERRDGQSIEVELDGEPIGTIFLRVRRDNGAVRVVIEADPRLGFYRPGWRERIQARLDTQRREVENWTPPDTSPAA